MRTMRYADVRERQRPPYATLSQGAAGTAYALWRLGETARASAWLTAALTDRRPGAIDPALSKRWRRTSMLFGVAGIRWVHALVAGDQRIDAYIREIRTPAQRLEFASGAAGHVLSALVLQHVQPHRGLSVRIEPIARHLLHATERRARRPWRPRDATGFAHGWPGVLYAVLTWHESRNRPIPSWLHDALGRLAAEWSPHVVASRRLEASWCNGAAGATLLWATAYSCTDDRVFLRVARRSGRTARARSGTLSSLCCGDVGVAYAALAMARIDSEGWREQARVIAARTLRKASMEWPLGLFQGYPGLVCLALDCVGNPRGFPAIEG